MKRIDLSAGARPNFMKIAPIIEALKAAEARGGGLLDRRAQVRRAGGACGWRAAVVAFAAGSALRESPPRTPTVKRHEKGERQNQPFATLIHNC